MQCISHVCVPIACQHNIKIFLLRRRNFTPKVSNEHTVGIVEPAALPLIVKVPIPDSILSKLYSIPVKRSV